MNIAEYGLPGTAKLCKGVKKAARSSSSHAIIMAHHGAVCFGKDYEETLECAKQLEEACLQLIMGEYIARSQDENFDEERLYQYYIKGVTGKSSKLARNSFVTQGSHRTQQGFLYKGSEAKEYALTDSMPMEVELHRRIYEMRPDINHIDLDPDMAFVALSITGHKLKPLLDDFAQLIGASARCANAVTPNGVEEALRGRYGALLPGVGAICCATNEADLQAVHNVMEKNAKTQIGAWLFGGGKALSSFDCILMNFIYNKSYAKKAKEI